jgi:membrane-bound inhibitor of C-type lysozyme
MGSFGWVLSVIALVAACALERPPQTVRISYECNDDRWFVAHFERSDEVTLELDGAEYLLPQASACYGRRFDDGTRRFEQRGRFAILSGTEETYVNCVARDWQETLAED